MLLRCKLNFCSLFFSLRVDRYLNNNALTTLPEGIFDDVGSDGSLELL